VSRILIIEDNKTMREGMALTLSRSGHKVDSARSGAEGLEILGKHNYDLVITDYRMAGMDGLEVLKAIKESCDEVDVAVITAYGTVEMAVEAMKLGAADYITKPFSPDEFRLRVEKILKNRDLSLQNIKLSRQVNYLQNEIYSHLGEMVGDSPPMKRVYSQIKKVANSTSSVLILGESGTGKELVAGAIHINSSRRAGPFIKVNCAALAEGVLESELFGHEKGAFTGAYRTYHGRFELADGGSLFLDEISEIGPSVQQKLLRVLQEKEFQRVGGERTLKVDVRLIAATNRDLAQLVAEGKFREDLFFRLHVIPITVPPLRQRKEDIPQLVRHFLKKNARELGGEPKTLEEEAYKVLQSYDWPGNVRELENVIERAVVLSDGPLIRTEEIEEMIGVGPRLSQQKLSWKTGNLKEAVEEFESEMIKSALRESGGVKSKAARILGLKPSALHYKLVKYNLL